MAYHEKREKIGVPHCALLDGSKLAGMKGFSEIRLQLQQQQMGFQAEIRDFFFFWDLISMSKLMHIQDSLHSAPHTDPDKFKNIQTSICPQFISNLS